MTAAIVHAATVRCQIVNNQVRVHAIQGATVGGGGGVTDHGALTGLGDNDHPQYVIDAGDEMTGLLTMTGASAAAYAAKVRAAGDTGHRLWIAASGVIGFDPEGTRAAPSARLIPYSGTIVGLRQYWTTVVMDDDAYDFNAFSVQHGKAGGGQPVIIMQAHDGTLAAPTTTLANQSLGELAFRGCSTAGNYGAYRPGEIVGWSGATIQGHSVEDWGTSATGGALTFQTVNRGTWGRSMSAVLYDGGQFVLDPATNPAGTSDWTLPSSRLRVVSQSATERTIVAKAAAAQSVPVFEVQDSNGVAVVTVSAAGAVALGAGSTMGGQALVTTNDSRLSDARTPTDGSVTDAKVASGAAIALSKLASISTARILGRTTAGTGVIEELSSVDSFVSAASDTTAGKVELATAAETTTGTDATRAVTPDGLAGSVFGIKEAAIQASDMSTAITTGDGKAFFRVPASFNGMNLIRAHASLGGAQSTSGTPTIQIRRVRSGIPADMLSTKITIDANESSSDTAATAPVIDTGNDDVATGDLLFVDIDVAGTGAKGLQVTLEFQLP